MHLRLHTLTEDERTIYHLQQRLSAALEGQTALNGRIQRLELDKRRLERQVEELRQAVAALLTPPASEQSDAHAG